jgi:hypothetical protein
MVGLTDDKGKFTANIDLDQSYKFEIIKQGTNYGTFNKQKVEVQRIASNYISQGHDVYIITKRYGPEFKDLGLTNEHLKVWDLAKDLNINQNNCIFTNREWKSDTIKSLDINKHFENSEIEVKMIQDLGILVVHVEDPYWRDLVY